jgi:hypothetical protein
MVVPPESQPQQQQGTISVSLHHYRQQHAKSLKAPAIMDLLPCNSKSAIKIAIQNLYKSSPLLEDVCESSRAAAIPNLAPQILGPVPHLYTHTHDKRTRCAFLLVPPLQTDHPINLHLL